MYGMKEDPDLPPVRSIVLPDRHPIDIIIGFVLGHLLLLLLFLSYYLVDGVLKEAKELTVWTIRHVLRRRKGS